MARLMKKSFYLLVLLLLASCRSDSTLEMQTREFIGEDCQNCPLVQISIPEASDRSTLGKSVNTALREEIITLLDYDEERSAEDIPGAIADFQSGFQNLQEEFPEELTRWEARVEAIISYEDPNFLGLEVYTYIYTGGAHGYAANRFLNFDKKTREELYPDELFADIDAFRKIAETTFRAQYEIPSEAPINSTGFMFEDNKFHLPENIGFTAEGLVLHYNPYEAASYADGNLVLVFPMEKVSPYLAVAQ